ncbi:MAG: DUF6600 domain-containing protein [Thermodesulfovibrionales bacterium]
MKTWRTVFLALTFLLLPLYSQAAGLGDIRISYMEGDVQIKTPDTDDWGAASINGPLMEGDQVWVPEGGRVELQLNTGTYIRLDQNSALQILSLDKDTTQFNVSQGHAYIYFSAPRGRVLQVDTPDVSARAFDKAVFRVDMSDQYQYTDVSVYRGYVEAENEVGKTRIGVDQMVSIGQNTNAEGAPIGPSDEWEQWNKSRNDLIRATKGTSSRYLPPELSAYSNEFDTGGRWVDVPEYGHVWTPTLSVSVSWAPYRDGRWIWRGGEYIWVSSDPWGWAPYHYGRWAFVAGVGWLWVPPVRGDVYWGPGYVGWVNTGDYVAWVPLAPGELYYGRGNYGRHSVNITNVNINQVNVTNVYKNVNINNGVTVVNRNTFATASPKIVNVNKTVIQQQIFVKKNISVGAPAIKPTKESYFASAKHISPAKLPPQPVKNMQVTQLKQSRPFVKDSGKSVFNPGAKPKSLPLSKVTTPRTPGKVIPQVKTVPGLQGKAGVSGGLAPRSEKGQIKSLEKKVVTPESGPAPKGEKGQIKQYERRAITPEGGPAPKGEKGQIKPMEKKVVTPEGSPAPKGEKGQFNPIERKAVTHAPTPAPKVEKREFKPVERKAVTPESAPAPKVEKREFKPVERKAVTPAPTPAPKVEKREFKPVERKAVTPAPTPAPKVEKREIKPVERKAVTPESAPPPKGAMPKVQPAEKVKPKVEEKPKEEKKPEQK